MQNLPQLSNLPFPMGTYIRSFSNEFYLYVEKSLELSKSENLVLVANDKNSFFSLHWVGNMDNYLESVERFWEIYRGIIKNLLDS